MPDSCAKALAPTTALFGCTVKPVVWATSRDAGTICEVTWPVDRARDLPGGRGAADVEPAGGHEPPDEAAEHEDAFLLALHEASGIAIPAQGALLRNGDAPDASFGMRRRELEKRCERKPLGDAADAVAASCAAAAAATAAACARSSASTTFCSRSKMGAMPVPCVTASTTPPWPTC